MPSTPEQIKARQHADATADLAKVKANLPAMTNGNATALAVPDNRSPLDAYLDEVAPATIAGRMVKFTKNGEYATTDDDTVLSDERIFVAMADQTLIGWIKFNAKGEPPDRVMGLLYENFAMPARESLGDTDVSKWETGLDGKPADPWQHHQYLVLQDAESKELFTFVTGSVTGRRAVGTLLKHYNRMRQGKEEAYPLVKLKVGGFQHRDDRVGWVKVPVIAVVGRTPKEGAVKPDNSSAEFQDSIPF
jgi:hypothetical protein